ncbi:hypothetical protein AQUCO_03400381v1 [Aquilegia coerulea]|uniref:Uncharacterized protein n=1 Tax=Aquilegia coerulea TaxID=218851 RepID=A0A2G5CYX0_AQUCA|nr:hypothetical protein AQUCO_03400381v1 [Aquilegia coerulea]
MCEEMELTHLQQTLRNLCFKSEWKYAVFWKLKHRARMMLTWEDAYYANNEPIDRPDQMSTNEDVFDDLHDGRHLHDPLGLAVAKMSYLVYSLGEGIIGQVAVTGKHQWIYADKLKSRCWSSSEYCDGWQSQFSAGIKTIAVVAVVPHGVVQLGSLHSVTEDMKLVTHIKDVFCSLQNSSTKIFPYPIPDTTQSSSYLSEVSAKISGSDVLNEYPLSSDNIALSNRKIDVQSYSSSSPKIFHGLPEDVLAHHNQNKTVEMVSEHVAQRSTFLRDHDNIDFLQTKSVIFNSQQHKQAHREQNKKVKCEEGIGGWRNMVVQSRDNGVSVAYNNFYESPNSQKSMLPHEDSVNFLQSSILCSDVGVNSKFDRISCLQNEEVPSMKPFEMQITESEVSCTDTVNSSLRFSAGCELYEALGPAFSILQDNSSWSESERTEVERIVPLEGMVSSLFTTECRSDYLLEAVVTKSSNTKSENAFSKSAESVLTTGKTSETSNCIKHGNMMASGSVGHSAPWVENAHENVKIIWDSTEVCNLKSSKELSSKSLSMSSKQSEIQTEQVKVNRKRARPGESCRPRPRDRQLIQDRVKELRELVPNGSKVFF